MMVSTVDDAIAVVKASAPLPRRVKRPLKACDRRVVLQDIVAKRDQPPFVSSAMDGYAVVWPTGEVARNGRIYKVIGLSQAGKGFAGNLGRDEAVRIFTGAPVPAQATAVILQENVIRVDDIITVASNVTDDTKTNIRARGQDFKSGETVVKAGECLDGWRISLVAATGAGRVAVSAKPRIVILCTGNELVAPGNPVRDDQIFESTSFALMSLVKAWGGKAAFVGVEKDSLKGIAKALRKVEADLIVTVGGASVGDYDLVKPALLSIGYDPSFDKVDLRPGRPTSFGKLKGGPFVLGLPGNPASALVCAQLFLKPFVQTALGRHIDHQEMNLPCLDVLPRNGARQAYLRAKFVRDPKGCPALMPFADQDSALIQVFAGADALIVRPALAEASLPGDLVAFIELGRR